MKRFACVLMLVLTAGCATRGAQSPASAARGERTAVLITLNDVYRIEGLEDGRVGGLARVRSLRKELERDHPDLLVLHGGDFLFPSFASRMFNGEQMVAVLNTLDGVADGATAFDERMLAVFGNHELEKTKLADAAMVDKRLAESQFRWLGGNITFKTGDDGQPLVADPQHLARTAIVESGGIRIGIFGITIPVQGVAYVERFDDPVETARRLTADLRAQGAEVVVALTHLNFADDRRLLATLGDAGPDLIIGGHDHEKMVLDEAGRKIVKADADARTAAVVRLTLGANGTNGKLRVDPDFRQLEGAEPGPDPDTLSLVGDWQAKHEQEFCKAAGSRPGCLGEVYGFTRTLLEAEENKIRSEETSLGDWVADQMVAAMKDCGAQIAFTNSGSLRLNQDLPAGTRLTRRHVEELFAYPSPLRLVRIDGATLQQALEHAVSFWPGSGSWLQISGFAYEHDTTGKAALKLTLLAAEGARPIRPDETILVATNDFLVDPEAGNQDGYTMLDINRQKVAGCAADGRDLKEVVVNALKAAGPRGIDPEAEGRVCQPNDGRPCLAGTAGAAK